MERQVEDLSQQLVVVLDKLQQLQAGSRGAEGPSGTAAGPAPGSSSAAAHPDALESAGLPSSSGPSRLELGNAQSSISLHLLTFDSIAQLQLQNRRLLQVRVAAMILTGNGKQTSLVMPYQYAMLWLLGFPQPYICSWFVLSL